MQANLAVLLSVSVSVAPVASFEPMSPPGSKLLAPEEAHEPRDSPVPLLAAALTGLAPLGFYAVVNPNSMYGANPVLMIPAGVAVGSLALASGYVYAGDPLRGVWVSLGAIGVAGGGIVGVPLLACILQGGCSDWGGVGALFLGMAVTAAGLTAYYVWAISDAYTTAEKAASPAQATPARGDGER